MTLQKFSDKSFLSMFKTRLKSAVFFPIIGLFFVGIYAVISPFSEVIRLNNNYHGNTPYDISIENVKFILFDILGPYDDYFPDSAVIMYFTVVMAAILCAVMVFRDLSNKKTANVYYSLGFSRNKLFASTYLAGAVSVLGMVVIPFALSFIINAFAFGISKELLSACIFTVSVLSNVSLVAYTISAIAMTLSGMLFEGVFFSIFLNAVSPIFTFSACMFSDGFLTGGGLLEQTDYFYGTFENSFISAFLGKLSFLNNLSHSATEVNRLGCCLYTSAGLGEIKGFLAADNWTTPKFGPLLVWTFILAGLIFLALCIFNRKKVENIGFFASSPVLYRIFFGTLIVGFSSLGCSAGRTITKGLTWLYVLIILVICLAITAVFAFILTKLSRMKFKKEFKAFGIYSLAVILFAFVFSSGFFGYTNRIPAVEKVAEVEITALNDTDMYNYESEIWSSDDMGTPIFMSTFSSYAKYTFTSKADITDIEELHKGLIKADDVKLSQNYKDTSVSTEINIVYTLKNGKKLSRTYYRITPQLIEQYLSYKGIGEKAKLYLTENLHSAIAGFGEGTEEYYEGKVYENFVTVFPNDITSAHNVELTEEQLYGLLAAYTMDVENLSAKELFAPKGKALGVITLREDKRIYDYDYYDEETGEPIVSGTVSEDEYSSITNNNLNVYGGAAGFIVINENMVNTIKWTKEVGIYKYFANDYKVEISSVEATYNNSSFIKLALSGRSKVYNLMFEARSYRDGDSYSKDMLYGDSDNRLIGSHYVMNLTEEEIRYLRENAHPSFLTTETGYFLRFTTNEKEALHAVLFVPDSKLTPELKLKLAVDTENGIENVTTEGTVPSQYNEATTYIAN